MALCLLYVAGMRVVLGVVLVMAVAGTARADGWYFLEGFGVTEVKGDMASELDNGLTPFTVRAAVGRRVGVWSVEAFMLGTELSSRRYGDEYGALAYGLDARYHAPITDHVELYLRGGLGRLELQLGTGNAVNGVDLSGYGGRGLQYGAGVQVGGQVRALGLVFWPFFFTKIGPKIHAAAWFDTGAQVVRLHQRGLPVLDGKLATWTIGLAVGTAF